jgi:acyl-CoA dehydrogenase
MTGIEYDDSNGAAEMTAKTKAFMDEVVIPAERALPGGEPISEAGITELQEAAREYGVFAPQVPAEYGGHGLDFRSMLPIFEQAGRSLLGPIAMRVNAPDEGNMHLLELAGTDEQKRRYLGAVAAGEMDSAFAMTEPMDGGGADPKMIKTTAEKDTDEWVIDGHKWWTGQAPAADVLIVMARTDPDAHPYSGTSMFLVDPDQPGVDIVREIPKLGDEVLGMAHSEIRFDGVRVSEADVLGELNEGFALAQRRLAPARVTHCMRYSGLCERALDVAKAYTSEREGFGERLTEKQALRHDLADAETRLHAVRSMVRHAARRIAAGDEARVETAMCKVFGANVFQDVVDTAVQMCGANGIGKDLPIADFYEDVRILRIADGPDEVHRRTIARHALEEVDPSELERITRYGEAVSGE